MTDGDDAPNGGADAGYSGSGETDVASETPDTGVDSDTAPPWYQSPLGLGLVGANLFLLLLLVVVSSSAEGGPLGNVAAGAGNTGFGLSNSPLEVDVPGYVYAFGAIGALGYVFTLLVVKFERSAASLGRMSLRIPAALPLCAGVYLLAEQLLGEQPPQQLVAGLAFLAGLYVDLTYRRLDALARRLLPSGSDGDGSS
jgi:hypothetical protein